MRTPPHRLMAVLLLAVSAGCTSRPEFTSSYDRDSVRPVVAVTSFENRSGFPGEWQLGSGMADLLVSELVRSKGFTVVERQHLESVVGELTRQRNDLFRPEGKVDMGKLKNAQFLVRGVINDFSQVGGGAISVAIKSLFFGGRGYNARVSLTMTIVDVESGEIIDSVQCAGTSRARQAYAAGAYKGVTFGGDAFFKTPLGQATGDAIRQGVLAISDSTPRRRWRPMIATAEGGAYILNGGADRGYRVGEVYRVRERARPVTDPATGDVLALMPGREFGSLKVTRVDATVAFGEAVSGSGFERGHYLTRD